MTYFKLDIPKLNESISNYNNIKKNCLEDINITYRGIGYVESAWNDPNVYTFIEKTKRDKYKLNEYFNNLDNLYNEISQFKNNIDGICNKHGYRRNSITLKFDDSDIDTCKRYLNSSITFLDDSLNKININLFDQDFEHLNLVHNLRDEIKKIRNIVKELIQDISNFTYSVNNEIIDSKFRLKRVSNFSFDLKVTDYKWKVANLTPNKTNFDLNIKQYEVPKTNSINIDINNDELLVKEKNGYQMGNNVINLKESNEIDNLNKNINAVINNGNKIDLGDNQEISGLNNNINTVINNENKIDLNSNEKSLNLNKNLLNANVVDNKIKTQNNDIDDLNKNIVISNSSNQGININKVNSNNELLNNVEKIEVKNNSLNTDFNNTKATFGLGENISQVEVTNNNNLDTSNIKTNVYNLNGGITEVSANQNNISISKSNVTNIDVKSDIKIMESLDDLKE